MGKDAEVLHEPKLFAAEWNITPDGNGNYAFAFLGCTCGWNSDGKSFKKQGDWYEHLPPAGCAELSAEVEAAIKDIEKSHCGCEVMVGHTCNLHERVRRLRNALLRASQAGEGSEGIWRKLLWSNHARYLPFEHTPYGDDGEMQCCGIDFKRLPAEEIERLLVERSLRHIQQAGSQ